MSALAALEREIVACRRCPRLVAWREQVAREKRAAFRDWDYWGRPVPGFGDPAARVVLLGLAPAAHGGNRTGRVFTGDRSGDFLYAALHATGYANQPTAVHRDDGLRLSDCFITAAVRCAPPANKPLPAERDACRVWLDRELGLLEHARVIVCLGKFAWDVIAPRPLPRFGHGAEARSGRYALLGCFHPSQQNTFTGKLTAPMLEAVLRRAHEIAEGAEPREGGVTARCAGAEPREGGVTARCAGAEPREGGVTARCAGVEPRGAGAGRRGAGG